MKAHKATSKREARQARLALRNGTYDALETTGRTLRRTLSAERLERREQASA